MVKEICTWNRLVWIAFYPWKYGVLVFTDSLSVILPNLNFHKTSSYHTHTCALGINYVLSILCMSICVSGYIWDLKFLQHWRSLLLSSGLWWHVVSYMGTNISVHAPSIFMVEGRTVLPWRWSYQNPQIIITYIPIYMALQPRDLNLHSYICWMVLEENGQVVNPLLTRKRKDVKQKHINVISILRYCFIIRTKWKTTKTSWQSQQQLRLKSVSPSSLPQN